jgi:hypothetical protein
LVVVPNIPLFHHSIIPALVPMRRISPLWGAIKAGRSGSGSLLDFLDRERSAHKITNFTIQDALKEE